MNAQFRLGMVKRTVLAVAGLAAICVANSAFAGNVYYPATAATPYYYTTGSYGGAGPMMPVYRPVVSYPGATMNYGNCPGGVCPVQPSSTMVRPAMTGVPGNCPGGICYPTTINSCPNGQCPTVPGARVVYPANSFAAPKAVPTAPVYYTTPKVIPAAVDTPIFYESGTPVAPKATKSPIVPVSGIGSGNNSPFYP
ncbi:MAG: hypothetical protein AB7O26_01020 [Planctomycetaceae bacterium]